MRGRPDVWNLASRTTALIAAIWVHTSGVSPVAVAQSQPSVYDQRAAAETASALFYTQKRHSILIAPAENCTRRAPETPHDA